MTRIEYNDLKIDFDILKDRKCYDFYDKSSCESVLLTFDNTSLSIEHSINGRINSMELNITKTSFSFER
jgi:hypothetical protein